MEKRQIDNNKYSVVIPTMWKSNKIFSMLSIYEKSQYVEEIIIINNNYQKTPKNLKKYSKLKLYTKYKNLYVNSSWNWGNKIANYNLILANDDLIIRRLDELIFKTSQTNYDIIGLDADGIKRNSNIKIKEVKKFPRRSYGCFMLLKKYYNIPEDLKIFFGDNILFQKSKLRGIFSGLKVDMDISKTIGINKSFFKKIINNDKKIYKRKYKNFWI